jgi:hypothetical protein
MSSTRTHLHHETSKGGNSSATLNFALPRDRKLPKLLFVTHTSKLGANIGAANVTAAVTAIQEAGLDVYDVPNPTAPWPDLRQQLSQGFAGIVILGGYDVLPAVRLDVLPATLRASLATNSDADNFIIWSDDSYGDVDGDTLAEFPVSRIPDAHSAACLCAMLGSKSGVVAQQRFGVRNAARPFAQQIFQTLPGTSTLLVSAPTSPATVGLATSGLNYFMLHGSYLDSTTYAGENTDGSHMDAFNVNDVPTQFAGTVFAGCCWGALTVDGIASQTVQGHVPAPLLPAQSVALTWLQAGARAFVGPTGSHYSPTVEPYDRFGGPLHRSFWQHILSGDAPAAALFNAKLDYLRNMPHGQNTLAAQALEFKTLREFCCLGLGW